MGNTMKRIMLLFFVLVLIYIQQATVIIYAENAEKSMDAEGGTENTEKPEGEDITSGEGEEDDEEPEEPKPEIKSFLTEFSKADGKEGIYVTKPEVWIRHVSERGVTRYQLVKETKILTQGILEQEGQEAMIAGESFGEGEHKLEVWMEDEGGQTVKEFALQETFLVDTQAPEIRMEVPGGFDAWHKECAILNVDASDGVSGVRKLICYANGQCMGEAKGNKGKFEIQGTSFSGKGVEVQVTAEDRAGNQSSRVKSVYIDNKAPRAEINGVEDYMITSEPLSVVYEVQEENILSECSAFAEWQNVQGKQSVLPVPEWENIKDGKRTVQRLTEDGIYQLKVSAVDKAGYQAEQNMQVIIDKENPVIQYVDRLDGKYMKSFCWDYPEREMVLDFTTFTSEVRLDGMLYPLGKRVREEGNHVLEVNAKDAAGNQALARAEFVIDHTPPEIIFKHVEEGKEYEEKQTFKVELGDPKDTIEGVQINGEKQKIHAGSKAFQSTVQEYQDYEIKVTAVDKAGNKSEKSLMFTVVPEKTFFQKIADPVVKTLSKQEDVKKHESAERSDKEEGRTKSMATVVLAIVAASAVGTGCYRLRRKSGGRQQEEKI